MEELDISADYISSGSSLAPEIVAELEADQKILGELALSAADQDDEGMFEIYSDRLSTVEARLADK